MDESWLTKLVVPILAAVHPLENHQEGQATQGKRASTEVVMANRFILAALEHAEKIIPRRGLWRAASQLGRPSIQRFGVGRTLQAGRRRPQNQACRLLDGTRSLGGNKACNGANRIS
jgi:hypothetical protein